MISRALETPAKRRLFPQRRIDAPPRALPDGLELSWVVVLDAVGGIPARKWEREAVVRDTSSLQGAGKDAHVDAALGDQDPCCVDADAGDGEERFD